MRFERVVWVLLSGVLVLVPACKQREDAEDEKATGGRSAPSARGRAPSLDVDAAKAALLAAPWKGVVAGKPALVQFKKSRKADGIWAVMTLGSKVHGCSVSFRRGYLGIATRGRPSSRGVSKLSLSGKLAPPFKAVSGKVSRVHKRGFTESSSGIGDFQLARGDAKTAVSFHRSACAAKSYASCFRLAVAYMRGDGVPKDGKQMVALFEKACVGGLMRGCSALGLTYFKGEVSIKKNVKKAKAYWGKACDEGHALSCRDLGHLYKQAKKHRQALRYYAKACAKPDASGCNSFAWHAAQRGKQLDRALSAAKKAVKLDPKAAFIDTLAYVFYKRKDYARAEIEAKRALSMEPQNAEFKKHLADIQKAIK
jgi:hypothetical protein